jgi:hypothetical protein
MRISFYGAFLLAMSILLLSYGGRTSGVQSAPSAKNSFASAGVIVTDVSANEFDNALATITEVDIGDHGHGRQPIAADAGTAKVPAL